jgi:hypothetical protein
MTNAHDKWESSIAAQKQRNREKKDDRQAV